MVAWQIAGWWTVVGCLRRPQASAETSGAGAGEAAGPLGRAGTSGSAGPARQALP